ncbi:unnamed protein product [Caenorhabditis nigoni]
MASAQQMYEMIKYACENITITVAPTSPPLVNGFAQLGCLPGIDYGIEMCKRREKKAGDCDKWLFDALTSYCKTDKSLEPCQILRTTKAVWIPWFLPTKPSTQPPITPSTSTTLEPTTESLASNFLILGVLGLIGTLILICLVIILLGIGNKKAGGKKKNGKKVTKTVSKTNSTKSKSTSGKSTKEGSGKMIP